MSDRPVFTRTELAELKGARERGEELECPRCHLVLKPRPVPRPPAVSYVRRRTWYLCPRCGRSAVLDD